MGHGMMAVVTRLNNFDYLVMCQRVGQRHLDRLLLGHNDLLILPDEVDFLEAAIREAW